MENPSHTQVINDILLCDDGYLINNAIKVPQQELLDYSNFNEIIHKTLISLTNGQNIFPIDDLRQA